MATITEDYVSFEIAKLLKEKGLYQASDKYYNKKGRLSTFEPDFLEEEWWPAYTLQMVMKWLLKKYNIFICILFFEESGGYGYTIEDIIKKKYIATSKNLSYKEPEEACEEAIKYSLKHLI